MDFLATKSRLNKPKTLKTNIFRVYNTTLNIIYERRKRRKDGSPHFTKNRYTSTRYRHVKKMEEGGDLNNERRPRRTKDDALNPENVKAEKLRSKDVLDDVLNAVRVNRDF